MPEAALDPALATRYPHQLAGGQRQRAAIARALAVSPRLLVLDEPTSAPDVTAQARVLKLVRRLRAERELAYLFITHNLAIAGELCEQTTVLYLGRVAETGPTGSLLAAPAHPYTLALLSSVPELEPARRRARIILPGGPCTPLPAPLGARSIPAVRWPSTSAGYPCPNCEPWHRVGSRPAIAARRCSRGYAPPRVSGAPWHHRRPDRRGTRRWIADPYSGGQ